MPTEFTPAVERAREAAAETARSQGRAEPSTVDWILALLADDEGSPAQLLARAGLDLAAVRDRVAAARSDGPVPAGVWSSARELALERSGDRVVASDVVLLALLRTDIGLRRQLEAAGLAVARLDEVAAAESLPPIPTDEPLHLADSFETVAAARAIDANANRAREALRVVEDFCRFALDDVFLSRELKTLRHDLAEVLSAFPPQLLLEARDTQNDVGTGIATEREGLRHDLTDVVRANLKRLTEALRSLEEFGKLAGPAAGAALERLRYRGYTVERAVLLGGRSRKRLADCRLCVLVSGAGAAAGLDFVIREAAAGGADMIQLREKNLDDRALLERARQVRRWTREAGVLFIVNDRPDIARLAGADGVHLGQEDFPVHEARRVVGPDALIGVSTHDIAQVRKAVLDGASYIGVGPAFASTTKQFGELAGLEFVRAAHAETTLPAFVIGGVSAETITHAVQAGAKRVAVGAAIGGADEPQPAARLIRSALPPLVPLAPGFAGARG
jgi:thiamine-phosphate pyrophosphorylase